MFLVWNDAGQPTLHVEDDDTIEHRDDCDCERQAEQFTWDYLHELFGMGVINFN